MPLSLERLRSETVTCSFDFLDEKVTVQFAPARYTADMDRLTVENAAAEAESRDEIETKRAAGDLRAAVLLAGERRVQSDRLLCDMLSSLIVSWDLLDGDAPYPTDAASLAKLPADFLWATFHSLSAENQPDPSKAPTSDEP